MRASSQDEASCESRFVPPPIPASAPAPGSSDESPPLHTGDKIVCVVQKARNFGDNAQGGASATQKVRRGDISHAVVVRTKKKLGRKDGSFVRFDDNACVLISKAGDPVGTRLNSTLNPQGRAGRRGLSADSGAQALLVRNSGGSSGQRFCLWLPCTCKIFLMCPYRLHAGVEDIIVSAFHPCPVLRLYYNDRPPTKNGAQPVKLKIANPNAPFHHPCSQTNGSFRN